MFKVHFLTHKGSSFYMTTLSLIVNHIILNLDMRSTFFISHMPLNHTEEIIYFMFSCILHTRDVPKPTTGML